MNTDSTDRDTPSPRVARRSFLGGLVGAGVAAPLTALTSASAPAAATTGNGTSANDAYPFHGQHQQGILTPPQSRSVFIALDVTASDRNELGDLFKAITDRARFLTSGGRPATVGITAPPSDSGVLGPDVVPDGLTVTLGVGASLFDDRFGLASRKPARLRQMDEFVNDSLRRDVCDGDLLLQLCAHSTDTLVHALRDITRATRGAMQVRWRQDGFKSAPRPSGTSRNLMGFKDGTANPDTTNAKEMDRLVWTHAGGDEPEWVEGGTYHVVRVIRMLVEFWDRVNIREQENMIGRRRDTGAPMTGAAETDEPNYLYDGTGEATPLSAHIRVANPRTKETDGSRILRRSYNYDGGTLPSGELDMGLVFTAFNQDLDRQFVTVQKRLADEPLVDYIAPFGGGYFFALPGVRSASDWLGRGMLA